MIRNQINILLNSAAKHCREQELNFWFFGIFPIITFFFLNLFSVISIVYFFTDSKIGFTFFYGILQELQALEMPSY